MPFAKMLFFFPVGYVKFVAWGQSPQDNLTIAKNVGRISATAWNCSILQLKDFQVPLSMVLSKELSSCESLPGGCSHWMAGGIMGNNIRQHDQHPPSWQIAVNGYQQHHSKHHVKSLHREAHGFMVEHLPAALVSLLTGIHLIPPVARWPTIPYSISKHVVRGP